VMPSPGTTELNPNTVVTVVFDRPVVPLVALGSQGELPNPLTFVPAVRGQGEWLNTSIYQFRADDGFLPATLYKARVAAGLTDTTGGVLEEDYTWEFSTTKPAILLVRPRSDFAYVGPTDVISVTFNQPMDHESRWRLKAIPRTLQVSSNGVAEKPQRLRKRWFLCLRNRSLGTRASSRAWTMVRAPGLGP
jgi:hypothetical protein